MVYLENVKKNILRSAISSISQVLNDTNITNILLVFMSIPLLMDKTIYSSDPILKFLKDGLKYPSRYIIVLV